MTDRLLMETIANELRNAGLGLKPELAEKLIGIVATEVKGRMIRLCCPMCAREIPTELGMYNLAAFHVMDDDTVRTCLANPIRALLIPCAPLRPTDSPFPPPTPTENNS